MKTQNLNKTIWGAMESDSTPFLPTKPYYTTYLRSALKLSNPFIRIFECVLIYWNPIKGTVRVSDEKLSKYSGLKVKSVQKRISETIKQYPGIAVRDEDNTDYWLFNPAVILGVGETAHHYGKVGEDLDTRYVKNGFLRKIQIANALYTASGLSYNGGYVLDYIQWHRRDATPDALPYFSYETMEKDLDIPVRSLQRAVKELQDVLSLKKVSGNNNTANRYDVQVCIELLNAKAKELFKEGQGPKVAEPKTTLKIVPEPEQSPSTVTLDTCFQLENKVKVALQSSTRTGIREGIKLARKLAVASDDLNNEESKEILDRSEKYIQKLNKMFLTTTEE